MAKSNGSGWDWSESLAERMRMQKNGNAVRWYVLTLPVSRRGHYQGEPARGLKAELDRRTRTGEPTFEYFAPSYIEVRKRRGELVDTRRPLLYNYVFVHASEAEIYRMKRFQPQYNFLPRIRTTREEYYPYLTDRAMENLRWVAASYSDVLPLYTPEPGQLMKGDRVRITEGQFKGVEATVISQPGAGRKEVMVCVEGCMYVPLLAVEPGQYEVIALNADNRHIYTRLGSSRLPDLLHEAMGRFHTPEGVTEEDRRTAREVSGDRPGLRRIRRPGLRRQPDGLRAAARHDAEHPPAAAGRTGAGAAARLALRLHEQLHLPRGGPPRRRPVARREPRQEE